jgi:O-antigen ligase
MIVSNPVFLERVQQSYEGNLAARELIFPIAIEMILEQPLVGWRPVELWYEISSRAAWREFSDAHNLFLHLLMEVGIVGAGPFFLGLWLCGRAAWQARSGHLSLMPLALLLTLLAVNLSGTGTYEKSLWLVLALGFAAEHAVARRHEKTLGYWYLKDGSGRVSHETVGGS